MRFSIYKFDSLSLIYLSISSSMGQHPPNFWVLNLISFFILPFLLMNNLKFQIGVCKKLMVKSLAIPVVFVFSIWFTALYVDLLFQNEISIFVKDLGYPV